MQAVAGRGAAQGEFRRGGRNVDAIPARGQRANCERLVGPSWGEAVQAQEWLGAALAEAWPDRPSRQAGAAASASFWAMGRLSSARRWRSQGVKARHSARRGLRARMKERAIRRRAGRRWTWVPRTCARPPQPSEGPDQRVERAARWAAEFKPLINGWFSPLSGNWRSLEGQPGWRRPGDGRRGRLAAEGISCSGAK